MFVPPAIPTDVPSPSGSLVSLQSEEEGSSGCPSEASEELAEEPTQEEPAKEEPAEEEKAPEEKVLLSHGKD